MLLLDANLLSPDWVERHATALPSALFTSSVSAQELLGMQLASSETRYRYALPRLDESSHVVRRGMPREELSRWISSHAKQQPVSPHTDRLVLPRSQLKSESLERGHIAVAVAHERGYDGLLRDYASQVLRRAELKAVLDKWEFLRREIDAVIPLDDEIAAHAAVLADQFVDANHHVKGTKRNTMNDMLVAATSHITGLPLGTNDIQLSEFYQAQGWSVEEQDSLIVATPHSRKLPPIELGTARAESRQYVNRPPHLRKRIDYNRSTLG